MKTMKTIEQIKEELPDVQINVNGAIYTGQIKGRKNKFATVIAMVPDRLGHTLHLPFEFSWAAIARAVNNGAILKV